MAANSVLRCYMFIKRFISISLLLSAVVSQSACMTARQQADYTFTSTAAIQSLSSNASLSYATPDRSISGSGILMFRRPDQIRAVILSPFGSVLQEVYASKDLVTIIDAANGVAFRGPYMDLPEKGNFSGWRYIHWLIDIDRPDELRGTNVIERTNRFGDAEKANFVNGLLVLKTTAAGGSVRYDSYADVQGVPFPLKITYETVAKEKFTILFEEPEINVPFADGAFAPDLGKYRIYPISSLK